MSGSSKNAGRRVDLVLEGGGVKGTGLVGAVAALEEEGYEFRYVAGASAGAIVAALLGAGYKTEELHRVLMELDYLKFKDRSLIDRVGHVGKGLSILREHGIYEGKYFLKWMRAMLKEKKVVTFADLRCSAEAEGVFAHRVQMIVSDLTMGELLVLPRDATKLGVEPDELEVALAVRMSMSIPIFFEPVWFPQEADEENKHLLVDGGVLSNFPVWLFDGERDCPTLGLRLVDPPQSSRTKDLPDLVAPQEDGAFTIVDYLKALASTAMGAHDRLALSRNQRVRTVDIGTLDVRTTDFGITEEKRAELYRSGLEAGRTFLGAFNYQEYLAQYCRGDV